MTRRGAQSLAKAGKRLEAGRAVKRASKKKRGSKTIPALGAAGLSLTLASEASLAATAPALDTMTRKAGVRHEIILREEEIFDVTLASFYVFDKERAGTFRGGGALTFMCRGCCEFACLAGPAASENNYYSPPVYSPPGAASD